MALVVVASPSSAAVAMLVANLAALVAALVAVVAALVAAPLDLDALDGGRGGRPRAGGGGWSPRPAANAALAGRAVPAAIAKLELSPAGRGGPPPGPPGDACVLGVATPTRSTLATRLPARAACRPGPPPGTRRAFGPLLGVLAPAVWFLR